MCPMLGRYRLRTVDDVQHKYSELWTTPLAGGVQLLSLLVTIVGGSCHEELSDHCGGGQPAVWLASRRPSGVSRLCVCVDSRYYSARGHLDRRWPQYK